MGKRVERWNKSLEKILGWSRCQCRFQTGSSNTTFHLVNFPDRRSKLGWPCYCRLLPAAATRDNRNSSMPHTLWQMKTNWTSPFCEYLLYYAWTRHLSVIHTHYSETTRHRIRDVRDTISQNWQSHWSSGTSMRRHPQLLSLGWFSNICRPAIILLQSTNWPPHQYGAARCDGGRHNSCYNIFTMINLIITYLSILHLLAVILPCQPTRS